MGTVQTINIGLPPLPTPPVNNNYTEVTNNQNNSKPKLLTDEEIDKLIESQVPQKKPEPPTIKPQPQPQPEEPTEDKPEVLKSEGSEFDLNGMNLNLNNIITTSKERIESLKRNQLKIQSRVDLLEKFIKLDEKELAVEATKTEPNTQKIIGLRKGLTAQTELFGQTLDILLKFEGSILSWTKTLMDVEKDKVAAFSKIKALNKEQVSTETDINEVLSNLNGILKSDPSKVQNILGGNGLSISGYGGKKFQQ